ncbi:MAG: peptide chain release factor N(5)-glutamine methyltransferase [Verrucomicrobiales bacterium]
MTTILDVITKGTAYLAGRGIDEARLNMEHLVARALACRRLDLYVRFDEPMAEEVLAGLRSALQERGKGVPLQHLLGEVEFFREKFRVDGRALIPRPETEELVDLLLKEDFPRPTRLLDLGCGSGVIGLSLAKTLGGDCAELVLADVSPDALALARENAGALGVSARFVESDLFSALDGSFDLVVANLPYVPESDRETLAPELAHDPALALFGGADGLDLIRRFAATVGPFLAPGALVALEVGHDQGAESLRLLEEGGLAGLRIAEDLSGIARFPLARGV